MKISVIIPTRNEEENISQAISRIRQTSDCNGIEIIVATGTARIGLLSSPRASQTK